MTSGHTTDAEQLRREARHLHALLFRGELEPEVADRYAAAHAVCFAPDDSRFTPALARVFDLQLDAEAIELVLRLSGRPTLLTPKMQILSYLLEARASYYDTFVSDAYAPWRGLPTLFAAAVRTVAKYAKGRYLVWRYRLA